LDELLARGTLGGRHYDEIFEKVVARTGLKGGRAARRWVKWIFGAGAVLVPAVTAWIIIARPQPDRQTAKGEHGMVGALQIGCGRSGDPVCRTGDTLMFSVNAAIVSGYLGAYAERIGDPTHERIWYYPTFAGHSPAVARGEGTVVLPDGIRIGSEHRPGHYRVTSWIADRPFTRAEVAAGDHAPFSTTTNIDLQVLP
jgi:hypothetical protein